MLPSSPERTLVDHSVRVVVDPFPLWTVFFERPFVDTPVYHHVHPYSLSQSLPELSLVLVSIGVVSPALPVREIPLVLSLVAASIWETDFHRVAVHDLVVLEIESDHGLSSLFGAPALSESVVEVSLNDLVTGSLAALPLPVGLQIMCVSQVVVSLLTHESPEARRFPLLEPPSIHTTSLGVDQSAYPCPLIVLV